jgi:hypothetical protein
VRDWSIPLPSAGTLTECAGALCVGDEHGLLAVNPADGSTRWSVPDWSAGVTPDPRWSRTGGLVLAADDDETRVALLDATTGRPVRPVDNGVARGTMLLHGEAHRPGRTWVTRLADGAVLDPVDDVLAAGCRAAYGYLSCPIEGDRLVVWRAQKSVDR